MTRRQIGEKEARQIYDEACFPHTPTRAEIEHVIAVVDGTKPVVTVETLEELRAAVDLFIK